MFNKKISGLLLIFHLLITLYCIGYTKGCLDSGRVTTGTMKNMDSNQGLEYYKSHIMFYVLGFISFIFYLIYIAETNQEGEELYECLYICLYPMLLVMFVDIFTQFHFDYSNLSYMIIFYLFIGIVYPIFMIIFSLLKFVYRVLTCQIKLNP